MEEALFQALASITCFGRPYSEEESALPEGPTSEKHKELSGDSTSKVMFVCTHLDLIGEKERDNVFTKKDQILRKKIETTEFYQKGDVSESQLIIKANNFNGDELEIENIREILMKVIGRNFDKIKIPASWLILSLYLRKEFSIVSLEECQKIASKLRIDQEELQDALWFLHHHAGTLLYYSEVKAMRDTVICKRQVVFDSASRLIRESIRLAIIGA